MRLSLPGGRHEVEIDVAATAACYARIVTPGPEQCGCAYCANWIAARDTLISDDVKTLLTQLGIPRNGEIEVWQTPGTVREHYYGGWYFFVGRLVTGSHSEPFRVGELEFTFGNGSYPVDTFGAYEPCELHFACDVGTYLTAQEYLAATRHSAERVSQSTAPTGPTQQDVARSRLRTMLRRIVS